MSPASVLAASMTEDQLLVAVGDALTLFGWRWTHSRRSDRAQLMGSPGLPDIIAVRKERLIFAELKAQRGRLSPEQRAWIADLETAAYMVGPKYGHPMPETWLIFPSTLDVFLENIR